MNIAITIFVSLISGLIGVIVGSWLSQRKAIKEKKIKMLGILITKRYIPTDQERVNTLNCIPLIYQKNKKVCNAFEEFKKAQDEVSGSIKQHVINDYDLFCTKINCLQDCYIKIMEEMAKDLKLNSNLSWDKLKKPYIPKMYIDLNDKKIWY